MAWRQGSEKPTANEASAFRRAMLRRGHGRGGAGEIVSIGPANGPVWAWTVTSSRRPGRLMLGAAQPVAIRYPLQEIFVPLWSLQELVTLRR